MKSERTSISRSSNFSLLQAWTKIKPILRTDALRKVNYPDIQKPPMRRIDQYRLTVLSARRHIPRKYNYPLRQIQKHADPQQAQQPLK